MRFLLLLPLLLFNRLRTGLPCGPISGISSDPTFPGDSRCSDLILYPLTSLDQNSQYRFDYTDIRDSGFGSTHRQGATVTISCTTGGRSGTVEGYDTQRISIGKGASLLATCTNSGLDDFTWTVFGRVIQFVECRY